MTAEPLADVTAAELATLAAIADLLIPAADGMPSAAEVVGEDELSAPSRRGATLRAVLAYSAIPVAAFPDDNEGNHVGVRVYRYHRPDSWEGLRP